MDQQKRGAAGIEGGEYQTKLILVSLLRAPKAYEDQYKLRTELKKDGKFDDLVLIYTKDGKEYKRCLQAKHKMNENNNIALDDLLIDSKKGFNLYAYFETYMDMANHSNDTTLKDMILFTNLKFNKNVTEDPKLVDHISTPNDIFHFGDVKKDGTVPAFYRFNEKFREKLKNFKLIKLAEDIIFYSHTKKIEMKHNNNTFKDYHNVLAKYVIDVKKKCFHDSFLTGKMLDDRTARALRNIILNKCGLNAADFKVILSNEFGLKPSDIWPKWTKLNKEELKNVKSFFNHLIFAANQPNEEELNSYIREGIKTLYELPEAETVLRAPHYIEKVRDWIKDREFSYLSKTEMDQFNKWMNRRIEEFNLLNISKMFCEELGALQINFQIINFQQKLNAYLRDKEKSIFNLQAIKTYTRSSSVKMLHALQNSESKYKFLILKGIMSIIMQLISLFVQSEHFTVLAMEVTDVSRDALKLVLDEWFKKKQQHQKLIIISDEFSFPAESEVNCDRFVDETLFDHLSKETKVNLLNKEVKFQSYIVRLNEIINEEDIQSFEFPNWWLPLVSNEEIIIGSELQLSNGYEAEKYIARELFQKIIIPAKNIENLKREDIVVATLKEFKQQVQVNRSRNVHLLKEQNDGFVWCKTHGSFSNIRNYINDDHYSYIGARKLYIIAANAGMGKSTITSYLTKKQKETNLSLWVIRFNLIDYTSELTQFYKKFKPLAKVLTSDVRNFICHELLKLHTSLEKNLFKMLMTIARKPRLIYIFDGFDEINKSCKSSVIEIVKNLISNRNVRNIIISTRPHLQAELEDEFSQFAIHLDPFNKNNKLQYLINYWSDRAHRECGEIQSLDERKIREKIEIFAEQILTSFSNTISDNFSQLIGVPLQMRMIAEILENDAMSYVKGESTIEMTWTSFSLVEIYGKFIDKKTEIYKKEKAELTTENDEIKKALNARILQIKILHAELAMNIIFESEAFVNETDEEMINSMLRFGLVHEINGKLYFIHQTFAEYYIAMYLTGKITPPGYDVKRFIGIFSSNVQRFINELITTDSAAYDHIKMHFLSILQFDTITLSFISDYIWTHYGPNLNLKTLKLLLECIHEIDKTNGSSDIISSLMKSSKYYFTHGKYTNIFKILIDNIKSLYNPKCVIFEELVSLLIDSMSIIFMHLNGNYYDEYCDLVKYIIDFLIFVEEKKYLDGDVISKELKKLTFVNARNVSCEYFLIMLDYVYDKKVNVFAEVLQKNVDYICEPESSKYFTWLKTKPNISSTSILNLMMDWCIEWMYVKNNHFFILNNYLTTVLNHSKVKYDVERLNSISDSSFTVPFEENFKRFFKMSPCNDMDKILIEFVINQFGTESLNQFMQVPDIEISEIEYYCLWSRFERLLYLLEDTNVESVRKKSVDILKSLKQRVSSEDFHQIISERNEYKESILQRACRENDINQMELISSWIDSDEIFETLTSVKDKSAFFLCATLLNLINEKFPDRVVEFLFSNSDVYFQERSYDMTYHPNEDSYRNYCKSLFDSLLFVLEERFNKDNLLKLFIINESIFTDLCDKMVWNNYFRGGVDRLLSIIKSKDIYHIMEKFLSNDQIAEITK